MFNINPRQMEQMMKKLGMNSDEIAAKEVVIKCSYKDIVISDPQVTKINMQGHDTFQIMGNVSERPLIREEDVKMVAEQTGASEEEAKSALKETGDIAGAILKLKKE